MKKSIPIALLVIFSLNLLFSNSLVVNCWESGDSITTISTNGPTIDGIKDDVWLEGNTTTTTELYFAVQITVLVNKTTEDYNLYILVEILGFDLISERNNEWVSIYLSRNITEEEDVSYIDKKQIIMNNAATKGEESSISYDLYQNDEEEYINDTSSDQFIGAAAYGSGVNRNYEFKLNVNLANDSENVNITEGDSFYLKIGHQYNEDLDEEITSPIKLIIKFDTDDDAGKSKSTISFQEYAHYTIIVVMAVFGVMIIRNKPGNTTGGRK